MPNESAAGTGDEWTTVVEESAIRILWEEPGEEWIGIYVGHDLVHDEVKNENYDYLLFRGMDGKLYSMSNSWKLKQTFGDGHTGEAGKVAEGSKVRLRYVKDVDMGNGRNPMRDIAVDVAAAR